MVSLSSSFICGNGQVWTRNNPPHSVFPFISRHSVRHCVQRQPFDVFPQHNMMDADSKRAPLSLSYSARQSLCRLFLLQSPTFSLRIQSREGNNTVIVDWQPCRRLHQFLVSKLNLFCYFLLLQTQRFSQSVYVLRDVIMGIASHYGRCRHTPSIIGNGTLRIFYTSES